MSSQDSLVLRLGALKLVSAYSDEKWSEQEALAHAIADLAKIGTKVSAMCERLLNESDTNRLEDELHELREELGHVAYHIYDSRYLKLVAERYVSSGLV